MFCGNGVIDPAENLVVWAQLSRANFIVGSYNGVAGPMQAFTVAPTAATSPDNPFGGYLLLTTDSDYGDAANSMPAARMNIKSGGNVPPGIIAELDRKLDDGLAGNGDYRVAPGWNGATNTCYTGSLGTTTLAYAAAAPVATCGAAVLQQ